MPRSDVESWRRHQNYYFNCICDMDRHLKAVLDALERNGQLENTIVIYTADHGERGGAHGMRQKAGTAYKEDIRVPFLVVHPGVKGGVTTKALASSVDIAPTLLTFAGLNSGEIASRYPALRGHDLSPAIHSASARTQRDRDGILLNYASGYGWSAPDPVKGVEFSKSLPKPDLMLRRLYRGTFDGRYKFVRYFAPAQHHTPKNWEQLSAYNDLELYDTQADPGEIVNLAHNEAGYRKEMLRLNAMVNALVAREVGEDVGREYAGPVSQYNTLTL
jgi:arylsulfatase